MAKLENAKTVAPKATKEPKAVKEPKVKTPAERKPSLRGFINDLFDKAAEKKAMGMVTLADVREKVLEKFPNHKGFAKNAAQHFAWYRAQWAILKHGMTIKEYIDKMEDGKRPEKPKKEKPAKAEKAEKPTEATNI